MARLILFAVFGVALLLLAAYLTIIRLQHILDPQRTKPLRHGRRNPREPTHLLVVLGSGGHTAEMVAMLERAVTQQGLHWKDFTYRTWVVGSGDGISADRARAFEETALAASTQDKLMNGKVKTATDIGPGAYDIVTVPRAREIHQPLLTAPISSIHCLSACYTLLLSGTDPKAKDFPDIILCNGPATATILVFTSVLLRFFNVQGCGTRGKMRTIYVESWARVKRLSLSGQLLKNVVDRFLVQWPQLESKIGGREEYRGILV